METRPPPPPGSFAKFGEMGRLTAALDWSSTPLGPIASWPQSLLTATGLCLANRFPMLLFWGDQLTMIYNDGYRPILGDKHPNALGRPGLEVWAEVRDVIEPLLDRVRLGGEAVWAEDMRFVLNRSGAPEEAYFTFSYSAIPGETGAVDGVLVTVTETTAKVLNQQKLLRAQAEAELQRGKLHALFMQAPIPIAVMEGRDLVYTLTNRPYEELVGRTDMLGRSFHEVWPELEAQGVFEIFDQVLATGETFQAREFAVWINAASWNQQQRYFNLIFPPVRDVEGNVNGAMIFAVDVTAQVEARKKAEQAVQVRDAFLSIASHELKTPLTSLKMQAQIRKRNYERGNRDAFTWERLGRMIDFDERQVNRLTRLIDEMLDVSRISSGKLTVNLEPVDLGELVREVAERMAEELASARCPLELDLAPGTTGRWDRFRIEQVFTNLLTKA
ncbi:MAG: PAS domain-containing protein, partial [Myxococcales bacterium]